MKNTKARVTPGQFLPLSIIRMIWSRRWFIAFGSVVLLIAAAAYVRRMPNVYKTDAVIIVDSQKIPEKFVASTVQVSLNDSVSAISQQVLSSDRLHKIITDFGLYPQLRAKKSREELLAKFRDDLEITVERGLGGGRSGAFRISFEGPSAPVVAGVVNRVADLFVQENVSTRERRAEGTSDFLEAQLQQAKKSLEEQERSLSQFKLQWSGELPQQETALLGTLNRLQTEFEANQNAINRDEQNRVLLENTLRFAESSLAAMLRNAQTPAAVAHTEDRTGAVVAPASSVVLRARLQNLQARYYDEHPEVRRAKKELAQALEDEEQARASQPAKGRETAVASAPLPSSVSPMALAEINRERERIASTKTQLELLVAEIKHRQGEADRIQKEMSSYSARVEKLPIREQQMTSLTRDYETTKANYHSLLDKKMSAEMARDMEREQQSERFTITDRARVPTSAVKPKRMMLYAGSAIGSLAFCLVLGLALELKKNQFLGEWELPPGIRVIGRVYKIDPTPDSGAAGPIEFDFTNMPGYREQPAKS